MTLRTGGKTPGIEKLARIVCHPGPERWISVVPVVRLVETQKKLRHPSSMSRPSADSWMRSVTRRPVASDSAGNVTSNGDESTTAALS